MNDDKFVSIKEDLQNLINEGDSILKCDNCDNEEDFIAAISPLYVTLEKGTNKITDIQESTHRIYDSVYFICSNCEKIIYDSVM